MLFPCQRFAATLLAALSVFCAGCAGYQLGSRSLYRPEIRTVHVPVFESESYRRYLGEQLTEAVIREIQLNTPYKVVHTPDADSVLTGRITSERKSVLAENENDVPRDIRTDLSVHVSWFDRRGGTMLQDTSFAIAPLDINSSQGTNFIPEGGQSIATAHRESIHRLARQIVSQMEARW